MPVEKHHKSETQSDPNLCPRDYFADSVFHFFSKVFLIIIKCVCYFYFMLMLIMFVFPFLFVQNLLYNFFGWNQNHNFYNISMRKYQLLYKVLNKE